jgi:hypothetical protein
MSKKELTAEQEQLARFAKALGHPIQNACQSIMLLSWRYLGDTAYC